MNRGIDMMSKAQIEGTSPIEIVCWKVREWVDMHFILLENKIGSPGAFGAIAIFYIFYCRILQRHVLPYSHSEEKPP